MKKLLVIIVVIAAVMGNSPQADAHEGQNVVRIISGIGGTALLPLAAYVGLSEGGANDREFITAFVLSTAIVGTGTLSFALASGLSGHSPHDYSAILTVSGAVATGVALTLPYTITALTAIAVPIAFIIDTLFVYGPYTDYRISLGVELVRIIPQIIPTILDTGYYSKGIVWGAVITPAVWVLGLGVLGLALGDDDPLAIHNDDGSTIRFSPLYRSDNTGFLISYTY